MLTLVYRRLTGSKDDTLKQGEAANGLRHVTSLLLTKTADSLIQPKLVLTWLMTSLAVPSWVIGLLVPIREAGALLPQVFLARFVEQADRVKYFWSVGSFGQGVCAVLIGLAALSVDGLAAGLTIVGLLALLALFRAICSVSYKDTLARTIPKTRRGSLTGAATSLAACMLILFGAALSFGFIPLTTPAISIAIMLAGALWILAAALFTSLREQSGDETANQDGKRDEDDLTVQTLVQPLLSDQQLHYLILVRAFLAVTALAPPFIIMLSAQSGTEGLGSLGPFVLAAALASILSGYVWGRLSDRSSRQTLTVSGGLAGLVYLGIGIAAEFQGNLGGLIGSMVAMFIAQLAYEGVRAGRKLHITDMVGDDKRAQYTAISNTLIGAALVLGGLFGLMADSLGLAAVFHSFGIAALVGAYLAFRYLEEVQED